MLEEFVHVVVRGRVAAGSKVKTTTSLRGRTRRVRDQRRVAGEFRQEVLARWRKPLDALLNIILECRAAGLAEVSASQDALQLALTYLWARGVQNALAIETLLEHGFADDADGRWRTLHEVNVVAQFLRKHSGATAQLYIEALAVKNSDNLKKYQQAARALGYPVEPPSAVAAANAERDAAVAKHGPGFADGDWGWAAAAISAAKPQSQQKKTRRVSFAEVERDVELDKWRAHFGLASHNVHGGPHGAFFRLGNGGKMAALAGPTLAGLAEPMHKTAISLVQLTLQLVLPRSPENAKRRQAIHGKMLVSLLDEMRVLLEMAAREDAMPR